MTNTTISSVTQNNENAGKMLQTRVEKRIKKRYAAEKRFRRIGASAILIAIFFLILLLGSIFYKGINAFTRSEVTIPIHLDLSTFLSMEKSLRKA